ncbi:MAG: hypothetical protein IJA37_07380 [Alistipes sp.]|nr:hypothetical protein [Alistipes sp.]
MADVKIKNVVVNVILLLLGVGNAVAAVFEWYDSKGMLIFNGVCVAVLIVAVLHKIFTMEARKMWRILAFLLSAFGVLAVFCSEFLANEIESWLKMLLLVAGSVLILLGAISMVRWRRESLGRKSELQDKRKK